MTASSSRRIWPRFTGYRSRRCGTNDHDLPVREKLFCIRRLMRRRLRGDCRSSGSNDGNRIELTPRCSMTIDGERHASKGAVHRRPAAHAHRRSARGHAAASPAHRVPVPGRSASRVSAASHKKWPARRWHSRASANGSADRDPVRRTRGPTATADAVPSVMLVWFMAMDLVAASDCLLPRCYTSSNQRCHFSRPHRLGESLWSRSLWFVQAHVQVACSRTRQ